MICKLTNINFQDILTVINDAATAYKGKIPKDRWKEPYMTAQELKEEILSGIHFYGYLENNTLIAVMGIQLVNDVTLIRHAYTLTNHQRKGIGEKLLKSSANFSPNGKDSCWNLGNRDLGSQIL